MTCPDLKIGDLARSKKNGQLLKVITIMPYHIEMKSVDMTGYPARKMCRKRQFNLFYEKISGE